MKHLLTYIFEKQTLTKLSQTIANEILDKYNKTKENVIELHKVIKNEDVIFKVSFTKNGNAFDDKKSKKGLLIINYDINDLNLDSITHEIRHSLDFIKDGYTSNNIKHNTYNDNEVTYFDSFLYFMSETEQNAFYSGFKTKLNKNIDFFRSIAKKYNANNAEDLFKKISVNIIPLKHKFIKKHGKQIKFKDGKIYDGSCLKGINTDNKEIEKQLQSLQNPCSYIEYKFYILDNIESFKKFIEYDEIDIDNKRTDKIKEHIIKNLSNAVGSKNIITDENKLYKLVLKKYMLIYNQYVSLVNKKIF